VCGAGLLAGGGAAQADTPTPGQTRISISGTYYIPTSEVDMNSGVDSFVFTDHNADGSTPAMSDVTIDASAFVGKVTMSDIEFGCGHVGLISTCHLDASHVDPQPFAIQAVPNAPIGFAGDITLTLRVAGAAPSTATVHAVIGRPQLVGEAKPPLTGVAPGTRIDQTPIIANTGQVATMKGFNLTFLSDAQSFELIGQRYSNCHYQAPPSTRFICLFTQDIAPGTAYATDAPVSYRTRPSLTRADVRYLPGTNDTYPSAIVDPIGAYPVPGDGPVLGLVPAPVPAAGDNPGDLFVYSDQTIDYQAVGATVSGKPGDVVSVDLGVKNGGPGVLNEVYQGGFYEITLPAGVSLTSDAPCEPWTKPATTYRCILSSALPVGSTDVKHLKLRIDRKVEGAVGKVEVIQPINNDTGEIYTHDPDKANDVAPIVMDVTDTGLPSGGPGSSGTPTPSDTATPTTPTGTTPPATNAPGPNGGSPNYPSSPDGSLAATGSSSAWPITAAAAAALLIGTTAFLTARRRRTHRA
jgi:LPXTG-motif cell wall-anchored protein